MFSLNGFGVGSCNIHVGESVYYGDRRIVEMFVKMIPSFLGGG